MTAPAIIDRDLRLMPSAAPPPMPQRVVIDEVIETSFKDFHVKGFDYICLKRSDAETLKVYIFDGDCAKLPTLVAPHDHRYDFTTTVIAGVVDNLLFVPYPRGGTRYQRFAYRTPLNGGNGFEWAGEARLAQMAHRRYRAGASYPLRAEQFHTIAIRQPQSMVLIRQFEDVIPTHHPTSTFMPGDSGAPIVDPGLYSRFTPDQVRERLALIRRLAGFHIEAA